MMLRYAGAWIAVMCLLGPLRAQDAHFTQFYSVPTYLSPAFAGTSVQSRFALQYRDQWPAIPGAFVTYNVAFDHYLSGMNSGIGFIATNDQAGSGALRYTSIAFQYAYEIQLKRRVFLRPALQFGYVNHAVDYSRLIFGDQLVRGGEVSTFEAYDGRSINYSDIGSGLLFFTPKMWLGVALHHMNEPNQSLLDGQSRVPKKFSMQGGYRIKVSSPVIKKHAQSVVMAFNYRAQEKFDQLDFGAYFERDPVYGGLWYRGLPLFKSYAPGYNNNDAIAVVIGFKLADWRFGYSYDITISRLAVNTGGAHELTAVYELANKRKKKAMAKRRVVPCAKF
ncbi:MAG TPA: type IX secretion system membrane protein PorP/SprF [Flavobacteriales bacterium]|nr:type IX secretion system membrane protein PorP/SprF [Flavobacteriales bacterium]